MDENTQSGLDTWAAKALDGLALTPTPAVQQEVSQDPFTGSRKDAESPTRQAAQAGLYLSSPLLNALTAVPTAHGATCMQQRAVALRDLQTAKKYGTITRARHDPRDGTARWKIEFGGVVYITDWQQKSVITTYQIQPRVDSLYIGPAPPPPTYPPPIYMPPAPILTPIVEGSIPLFQPPPPPMILRSTAWPVAPPVEVKICAACGYSLPEAAFTKKQWSWKSPKLAERRRCNVCVKGRVVGGRRDW